MRRAGTSVVLRGATYRRYVRRRVKHRRLVAEVRGAEHGCHFLHLHGCCVRCGGRARIAEKGVARGEGEGEGGREPGADGTVRWSSAWGHFAAPWLCFAFRVSNSPCRKQSPPPVPHLPFSYRRGGRDGFVAHLLRLVVLVLHARIASPLVVKSRSRRSRRSSVCL